MDERPKSNPQAETSRSQWDILKNPELASEQEVADYEKHLDRINEQDIYFAEGNADRLLADLTWRGIGDTPRERYENEKGRPNRRKEIDALRLFKEMETIIDYNFERDHNKIPESKFFRLLADSCSEKSGQGVLNQPAPLSEKEERRLCEESGEFVKYLSTDNKKEYSFAKYIKGLVDMCDSTFGEMSRASLYLCDDLDQILSKPNGKAEVMDRLMKRKMNAVSDIATDNGIDPNFTSFTAALDLPEGIEKHSMTELVEEGVPSLYGYEK